MKEHYKDFKIKSDDIAETLESYFEYNQSCMFKSYKYDRLKCIKIHKGFMSIDDKYYLIKNFDINGEFSCD